MSHSHRLVFKLVDWYIKTLQPAMQTSQMQIYRDSKDANFAFGLQDVKFCCYGVSVEVRVSEMDGYDLKCTNIHLYIYIYIYIIYICVCCNMIFLMPS